ncbi:MAG: ATPase domain-containing protein, partial [Halobacteriaceae archaeon]
MSDSTSTTTSTEEATANRISTGVTGIDDILNGGLLPGRSTLVRGPPGAGKTLFGLHYLAAGAQQGETGLFINLGEPEQHVREDAAAFGFDMNPIHFLDVRPAQESFGDEQDIFPTGQVEGVRTAEDITTTIDDVDPDRIFIDPLTQFRDLVDEPAQFRKQMMAFLRTLEDTAVVYTSQAGRAEPDDDLQFLSDGVIELDTGGDHRTISVAKLRGSDFTAGTHTLRITSDGMTVAPSIQPEAHERDFSRDTLSSGVPELDELLQGGLDRGTTTLLTGPTGAGKTTTGLQFMKEAAGRGEQSVLYSFEEARKTLLDRSEAVNIPVQEMLTQGKLTLDVIDPQTRSVDEFAQQVRQHVEDDGVEIVMIDSVDGYQQNLLGTTDDMDSLFALGRYLRKMGVTTIWVNELHQVTGEFQATEKGASKLADNIVFFRHIEFGGELRKVVGVLKQRTSDFEHTLRELRITE